MVYRSKKSGKAEITKTSGFEIIPGIYIVSTPIGNLSDISKRATQTLEASDCIFAEDTRVTKKLLSALGISTPLRRLDENTMKEHLHEVISLVSGGNVISYCSDAGMPGVSDPGLKLVRAAQEAGVHIDVLPGASAVDTAFVASGIDATTFYFGGFFPRKDGERISLLKRLQNLDAALIFYESPKRLINTLGCIANTFPTREVAICRELTKVHQEIIRGKSQDVLHELEDIAQGDGIKGEIVIVIAPASDEEKQEANMEAIRLAQEFVKDMTDVDISAKDLSKLLMTYFHISKNDAYRIAIDLK